MARDKDNLYKKWIDEAMPPLHKIEQSYAWAGAHKQVEFPELNMDQLLSQPKTYKDGYENFIEKRTEADRDNPKLSIDEYDLYGMAHSKPKVKNK